MTCYIENMDWINNGSRAWFNDTSSYFS